MKELDYLIEELLKERNEYLHLEDININDKKKLFRSLCNVREPSNISDKFKRIQDNYLK